LPARQNTVRIVKRRIFVNIKFIFIMKIQSKRNKKKRKLDKNIYFGLNYYSRLRKK